MHARPPRRRLHSTRLTAWFLVWSVLWAASGLRADIQDPNKPHGHGAREQRREQPAAGVAQTISIDQGESVEITLHSRGQIGKWIDFTIRSQPEHGSLGAPSQLTRDTAVVTYVHHASDGPGTDAFTYSVQAAGSGVSAPSEVDITIRDTAPILVATPPELDFGDVRVGDTSGADLVLENQGGGKAIGSISLPKPWVVDGPSDYRLAHSQRKSFHILFAPKTGRSFSEAVPLSTNASATTHLVGTGLGVGGPPDAFVSSGTASSAAASQLPPEIAGPPAASPAETSRSAPPPPPRPAGSKDDVDPLQALADAINNGAGQVPSVPPDISGYFTAYDSGLKDIKLLKAGRTTLDISWKPLAVEPKYYRIEMRYLAIDAGDKLRVEWRPYSAVDLHVGKGLCTATVRGLEPQMLQTLRVVAVDFTGRIAGGSATLGAFTLPASHFWRLTPLRVLFAMLLLCLGLALRRRWQLQRMVKEMDASRAASPDFLYRA